MGTTSAERMKLHRDRKRLGLFSVTHGWSAFGGPMVLEGIGDDKIRVNSSSLVPARGSHRNRGD
jgi:hypothetical protein